MAQAEPKQPEPLKLSRTFRAPCKTVFKAWSSAEHVKRWFCPEGYSVPQANVEMQPGGPFEVCMRAPNGVEHWTRGVFVEVVPHERLALDMQVMDAQGHALFRAYTEVNFADEFGGTRMDVVQTYTFADPAVAAPMVRGAPMGWSQTLDKLAAELRRMQDGSDTSRSVAHNTFHIERAYDAPVERVYKALSDASAKSQWFSGSEGQWQLIERHMDFRVGGRERLKGSWEGGIVSTFDATYHDIIPNERIIYTYEMHVGDKKISVSLATLELKAVSAQQTILKVTEQGAFLDGYDDAGSRERGTGHLLDRLGASLVS